AVDDPIQRIGAAVGRCYSHRPVRPLGLAHEVPRVVGLDNVSIGVNGQWHARLLVPFVLNALDRRSTAGFGVRSSPQAFVRPSTALRTNGFGCTLTVIACPRGGTTSCTVLR